MRMDATLNTDGNKKPATVKPVIIDINKLFTDGDIESNNLIHQQVKTRLESLLTGMKQTAEGLKSNNVDKCNPLRNQLSTVRSTNTIFINGQRGAGKTTFLKSILKQYIDSKNTDDKNREILPVVFIDPTLVGTGQHLLVDIIVRIDMQVKAQLRSCCGEEQNKNYRDKLEKMADGLKLLKNYESVRSEDGQWFQTKAFKDSLHGQSLEQYLDDYIDCVLSILNAKLLLIAIDDVDTETQAAYEVLEILRRYITHPQMCVILTGDEALYNFIVYEKKLESLGRNDSSGSHTTSVNPTYSLEDKKEMAVQLTQQYLLKILPVYQRLELQNLYSIINGRPATNIHVIEKGVVLKDTNYDDFIKANSIAIEQYLLKVLCASLYLTKKAAVNYVDIILRKPIRSILQLVYKIEQDKEASQTHITYSPYSLVSGLSEIFYTQLFSERFESSLLNKKQVSPNDIGVIMLDLYSQYGQLETGFYARPDTSLNIFNVLQLLLSASIANYIQPTIGKNGYDNHQVLSNTLNIMLTTGAACNIFMTYVLGYKTLSQRNARFGNSEGFIHKAQIDNTNTSYNIENHYHAMALDNESTNLNIDLIGSYSRYIGLIGIDNLYHITAHYSPIIIANVASKIELLSGVARTRRSSNGNLTNYLVTKLDYYSSERKIRKSGTINNLKSLVLDKENFASHNHTVNEVNTSYPSLYASIACVLASHSIHTASGLNDYVSCYSLLAVISELLVSPKPIVDDNNRDIQDDVVSHILLKRVEIPTYGAPPFFGLNTDSDIDFSNEQFEYKNTIDLEDDSNQHLNEVINALNIWKYSQTGKTAASSVLQGKIWARVFYSLTRVSEEMTKRNFFTSRSRDKRSDNSREDILLSEFMCISITAIINSFLIEESRFAYRASDIDESLKSLAETLKNSLQKAENVATTRASLEKNLKTVRALCEADVKDSQKTHPQNLTRRFSKLFPLTFGLMTCPLLIPYLIYDLGSTDDLASNKWSKKNNDNEISNFVKSLLLWFDTSHTIHNNFYENIWTPRTKNHMEVDNKHLTVDLRYISAIPIIGANTNISVDNQ